MTCRAEASILPEKAVQGEVSRRALRSGNTEISLSGSASLHGLFKAREWAEDQYSVRGRNIPLRRVLHGGVDHG
jgi:hypothetical protein